MRETETHKSRQIDGIRHKERLHTPNKKEESQRRDNQIWCKQIRDFIQRVKHLAVSDMDNSDVEKSVQAKITAWGLVLLTPWQYNARSQDKDEAAHDTWRSGVHLFASDSQSLLPAAPPPSKTTDADSSVVEAGTATRPLYIQHAATYFSPSQSLAHSAYNEHWQDDIVLFSLEVNPLTSQSVKQIKKTNQRKLSV